LQHVGRDAARRAGLSATADILVYLNDYGALQMFCNLLKTIGIVPKRYVPPMAISVLSDD